MPPRVETVASFAKGLAVLRSFGAGARRQTITDVAARTGLTRAGARRFLHTLVETGYARSDGKHFELTARVLEFGDAYVSGIDALATVRDVLHDLARDLGETVSAAVLDGADVVCVAGSPSAARRGPGSAIGERRPAESSAAGLALLARLSPKDLERFLRAAEARASAARAPAIREPLRARLAEVREHGHASVEAAGETGVHAFAVAVADHAA
ncbi:MAG: helix-turn-helix domain-containing protein, partial [Phyllobacteriaceae bacterium]|nr:helix-turn-helix domain-containing protein [Phyllobacteriaceae bacterium]